MGSGKLYKLDSAVITGIVHASGGDVIARDCDRRDWLRRWPIAIQ